MALPIYELSLLAILVFIPPVFLLGLVRRTFSQKSQLPPSPPGLPIIGNLHQLGSLLHRSLRSLSDKHGPLMLLHMGRVPTLVVSSADATREIMKTHDLKFASRPSVKVGRILLYDSKDLAFAPYGEYWRQSRKICVTHLLSDRMVRSFQRMREEEVTVMLEKVSSQAASGGAVDMSEVLNSFANDAICRVVSGKFSMEAGRNRVFREMIDENTRVFVAFHVEDYLPSLRWLDVFFGLTARAERSRKRWDDVLDEVIRNHADRRMAAGGIEEGGFVDVLLSLRKDPNFNFTLTNEDIKALLLDMFAAGTDTSYTTLEWAMAELVRNPNAMKNLQDEVREIAKGKNMIREEDLSELSYLRAVIMEALRLHPPLPLLLPRESMEDCEMQGYTIPKKTRVIINSWAIGRDPKCWDMPEEFRPERFIQSPVDFRGKDFQLIPFGAGRRICPGINFAVATNQLALANLMNRFDWELPPDTIREDMDMTEFVGIVAHKNKPLILVAQHAS